MMPVKTKTTNVTFVADGCSDLPATRMEDRVRTTWELSPEEREAVSAGGNIQLDVFGSGQPPVMLAVTHIEVLRG